MQVICISPNPAHLIRSFPDPNQNVFIVCHCGSDTGCAADGQFLPPQSVWVLPKPQSNFCFSQSTLSNFARVALRNYLNGLEMQLYPNQLFTWFMQVIWVNPNPIHLNAGSVFLTWTNLYLLHINRYGRVTRWVVFCHPTLTESCLNIHQALFELLGILL